MWITVPTLRAKVITPPEAYEIAGKFRAAAEHARTLVSQLKDIGLEIDNNWDGNSADLFFIKYNKRPIELQSIANWLMEMATKIENIKVTIWETVMESIWIPDS